MVTYPVVLLPKIFKTKMAYPFVLLSTKFLHECRKGQPGDETVMVTEKLTLQTTYLCKHQGLSMKQTSKRKPSR